MSFLALILLPCTSHSQILLFPWIREVVFYSTEFIQGSHDLQAFLHHIERHHTPCFENPVAHVHKRCPLQPSSQCFFFFCVCELQGLGGSRIISEATKGFCNLQVPKTQGTAALLCHRRKKKKENLCNSHTIRRITPLTFSSTKGVANTRLNFKYIWEGVGGGYFFLQSTRCGCCTTWVWPLDEHIQYVVFILVENMFDVLPLLNNSSAVADSVVVSSRLTSPQVL